MPKPKDILEGRPWRSPLHPMLVHLPLALFPLGLLLDLGSWIMGGAALVRGAYYSHMLGLGTGAVAALFGFIDYSEIRKDHAARRTANRHLVLNVVAIALFAVSAWMRRESLAAAQTPLPPLGLTLAAVALLSYSGYLGGRLVYGDGLAVGRHRHDGPLPECTHEAHGESRWREVAPDATLKNGGTLRVIVDGIVVVVVRRGRELHAVQEFCTHRFGPLSEGQLDGCDLMCPWHRSRFDVRTGKVTAGPAKEDLRTFKVESRGGRIWIEAPKKPD